MRGSERLWLSRWRLAASAVLSLGRQDRCPVYSVELIRQPVQAHWLLFTAKEFCVSRFNQQGPHWITGGQGYQLMQWSLRCT